MRKVSNLELTISGSVEYGLSLPRGWYLFVFPDGSNSGCLTGTNYPTGPILGTVHGDSQLRRKNDYQRNCIVHEMLEHKKELEKQAETQF